MKTGVSASRVFINLFKNSIESILDKKNKIIDADGLLATCIQHEIDHLNGILFIDHLSKLKREIILKKAIKEYSKS